MWKASPQTAAYRFRGGFHACKSERLTGGGMASDTGSGYAGRSGCGRDAAGWGLFRRPGYGRRIRENRICGPPDGVLEGKRFRRKPRGLPEQIAVSFHDGVLFIDLAVDQSWVGNIVKSGVSVLQLASRLL